MLAVFYGSDRKGLRNRASAYIETSPGSPEVVSIDESTYQPGCITAAIGTDSLFGGIELYILDTPSNNTDFHNEIEENLTDLNASKNIFIVLESSLLAAARKKYEKHADVCEEFSAEKPERFNTFALADALVKRDRRTLWLLLNEARAAGLRDEELIGILWWQLKALRLASTTRTAKEAGMKDFPYNKAKRSLQKFNDEDLKRITHELLQLYHDGHSGVRDLDLTLEKWTLSV